MNITGSTVVVTGGQRGLGHALVDGFLAEEIDAVWSAFETNVFGPLRVAQAFGPVLARNGGGALVNIMSVMSWPAGAASTTEVIVDDDSERAKRLLAGPPEGLEYTIVDGRMTFGAETAGSRS